MIVNSIEYESRLRFLLQGSQLAVPSKLSSGKESVSFDSVDGASSYEVAVDGVLVGSANVLLSGTQRWLFDEVVHIDDDCEIVYDMPFTDGEDSSYSRISIYGKDRNPKHPSLYGIYYDDTIVFLQNGHNDTNSEWYQQSYRVITASSDFASSFPFLLDHAVREKERVTIDISSLSGYGSISDGYHKLSIRAISGSLTGLFSEKIVYGKNVEFTKGVLYGPFDVLRVIDGDTVVVDVYGVESKVRMIGVNTPESVAKSSMGDKNCPEGVEASNYTKHELTGKRVYLEFDTDITDVFHRYLAYVYLDADKSDFYNRRLIEEGLGEAKYYSPNGAYRQLLEYAQDNAYDNKIGFWKTEFFPTKLSAPTISEKAEGNISIVQHGLSYVESFDIKINGVVQFIVPSNNTVINKSSLGLSSGTYRLNVVAVPTDSTHEKSNNSNNLTVAI